MILHIPHSSSFIPGDLRRTFLLSEDELRAELLIMTDAHTDTLFAPELITATPVIYPVSRLVVDPERFTDDEHEPMSTKGMGVVYVKTADGRPLRPVPTLADREHLLATYYHPHHKRLTRHVADELDRFGRSLIIDCHSFPSKPLPYEDHQEPDRPDICIGTDNFHTPESLATRLIDAFQSSDYTVALNRPFAGSLVPSAYYGKDRRVASIMIEVNRKLYMDEHTAEKNSSFDRTRRAIASVLALAE